ncbi:23S rRNA (adenine2503-C2)-methyltransferase [Sinobacterium caligoides]|uniref:Dual-specificity RNA methyltransferase RlmN n=1 Tax=Sinobacterium caligoides TaxID=933926 RepID=A0A3N2DZB5_9GAMM|nr:23S rRNA (adenine(2503)-C(2))-methyltransferase RlmN [Sinobacterium caligoides]ROS05170.1 23S rRNA (adenine2503-C2)-methyltransferase [Sinobacterium caligoides]
MSEPMSPQVVDAGPVDTTKVNLLGLSQGRLRALLKVMGEKPFRAEQLLKWIHHEGVTDFDLMTNISKNLRAKLKVCAEVRPPEIVSEETSADGTRKWVMRTDEDGLIETVFIPEDGRGTLCVSSQVGCSLDCSFCSTGKQGFQRDLTSAEIIGQVWLALRSFDGFQAGNGRVVTNVVMMGMGEPLLNFDNVLDAMTLMMDDLGYGISKRRVTLSTSGVVPALEKLIGKTDVSLAISLHAPNDELRSELVPINKRYPIKMLLDAVHRYMDALPDKKRVVTIEYTLISGVNDKAEHAYELAQLLKKTPCKINLIPFNPFSMSDYKKVSNNALDRFRKILQNDGYIVTVRTTRGDDIDAACGQLVGDVKDRTKRSARHRAARASNNEQVIKVIDH